MVDESTAQKLFEAVRDSRGPERFRHPWWITIGGKPWTLATDGYRLVIVEGRPLVPLVPAAPTGTFDDALAVLDVPLEAGKRISLTALRDFCGYNQDTRCPRCGQACLNCEHKREGTIHILYGAVVLNAVILRPILSALPEGQITIGYQMLPSGPCLYLRGDGWQVLQMGMVYLGSREGIPNLESVTDKESITHATEEGA